MGFDELTTWIPQTKLTPPRLRGDVVPRPRLLAALRQAVSSHALTLIAAPAGYGKTTLLVALAQDSPALAVAWFALDEQDDDPTLFLSGLIAALQQHHPACGQTAQAMLAQTALPVQRVVGVLINDLLATLAASTLLVLDDLHLVHDPAIYALLAYLIEHLPPMLRLVIATRHDPPLALARWRARGLLAELRLDALSFSAAEAADLLNGHLRLNLEPDELDALQRGTEGWVAGLRLLAGSLEHLPTRSDRIPLLQHLAQSNQAIADVLVDEVLNRQEPEIRSFLCATSILDELTPELCRAVTGRHDAEALLDTLYRRNLFLIALHSAAPTAPPSYRYHALFASFLRRQLARELPPAALRSLHLAAAAAEPVTARAIHHYLTAEAWDEAIGRIEQEGGMILRRGLRRTFQSWAAALPAELAAARPRLSYLRGVCAWQQCLIEEAYTELRRAADGFAAIGDLAGQGEAMVELAIPLFWKGDLAEGQAVIRQAMELPLLPRSRLHAMLNLFAVSLYNRRQSDSSAAAIDGLITLMRGSDDPEALRIVLAASHPLAALCFDSLDTLAAFFQQSLEQIRDDISPARIGGLAALAAVAFMQGRPADALRLGGLARAVSEQAGGYRYVDAALAILLAQVHVCARRYGEAERELRRGLDELPRLPLDDLELVAHLYVRGRLHWLRGQTEALRQVAARAEAIAHAGELLAARLARELLRGLLALAEGRLSAARQLLRAVAAQEEQAGLLALYGSAHPLLAHLALLQQRPQEALATLEPWLADCERYRAPGRILLEGAYVIPLLQLAIAHDRRATFAAQTLALLAPSQGQPPRPSSSEPLPLHVPATGETLTAREVEVLRLLATGATNRAIAEQLVIGEQTVKTHVARILRKLGAATRTEAAAHAHALGI